MDDAGPVCACGRPWKRAESAAAATRVRSFVHKQAPDPDVINRSIVADNPFDLSAIHALYSGAHVGGWDGRECCSRLHPRAPTKMHPVIGEMDDPAGAATGLATLQGDRASVARLAMIGEQWEGTISRADRGGVGPLRVQCTHARAFCVDGVSSSHHDARAALLRWQRRWCTRCCSTLRAGSAVRGRVALSMSIMRKRAARRRPHRRRACCSCRRAR